MRCIVMPWCRLPPYTPVHIGKVQIGWVCVKHYCVALDREIYVYPDLPLLEASQ